MPAAEEAISTQDMIARRSRLLGPAYRLFYDQPVQFGGGTPPGQVPSGIGV